jgi:hypothetical protein
MRDSSRLKERVRRGLACGDLFLIDRLCWSGPGSGKACAVCAAAIERWNVEYRVEGDQAIACAHLACYLVWRQECEALGLTGG